MINDKIKYNNVNCEPGVCFSAFKENYMRYVLFLYCSFVILQAVDNYNSFIKNT